MRVVRERQEPMVSLSFHPAKQQELQSAEMEKTTEGARLWGKKSEITIWTCWVWHVKRKCWGDDWIHKFKVQERGQDYNDKSMSHQQINLKPVMAGWDHEGNGSWRERKVRLSEMGQRRWMRAEPLHRQWFQERGEASQEAAKEVGGNPARDVLSWQRRRCQRGGSDLLHQKGPADRSGKTKVRNGDTGKSSFNGAVRTKVWRHTFEREWEERK